MLPRIVAFTGPIGAGKTTAAKALHKLNYKKLSFADPLKEMLMTLGLSYAQVYGNAKEIPAPILANQTPRHAMQTLGTEWGRNLIHKDLWVFAWQHRVQNHQYVSVDDARFPNEFALIKSLGGIIIQIFRNREPDVIDKRGVHESESYMPQYDYGILNAGTEKQFIRNVLMTVQRHGS